MITLRRASEREHERRRKHEVWRTFPAGDGAGEVGAGFGALLGLNESQLGPGGRVRSHPQRAAELITYVREGTVCCEDAAGRSCRLRAGEFQQRSVARGAQPLGVNPSQVDSARVFHIWLHAGEGALVPGQEPRRFSAAQRRGLLCVVASPDGRKGSLRVQQDVLMCSALLERGQHLVHELRQGRRAWLHLVEGQVVLGDLILGTGDGAGVSTSRAVSITAREVSEILLLNLREPSLAVIE